MTYGVLANAFNANNVRLWISGLSPTNELITLFNIQKTKSNPRLRINSRVGAADFYAAPLISVTAEAIVSKDVFQLLDGLSTPNARGALASTQMAVYGQNLSGNTSNDITTQFFAAVSDLSDIANENGTYTVRFTLIIADSTYSTS